MKQLRSWVCLPAFCLLALPVFGQESYTLDLGEGTAGVGGLAEVPLTLSTTTELQGLQAIFEWSAGGTGVSITPGAAIAGADVVAMRVEADFMVLGVVMDNDGQGGEVISPGDDQDVATASIQCGDVEGTFAVEFVDNMHAMVGEEPKLENLVVEGGLSIGAGEGLTLDNGSFSCEAVPDTMVIEDGETPTDPEAEPCGSARVLLTNNRPVEGYVTAVCHDPAVLSLQSITVGSAALANGADFMEPTIFANGGTLGVVMDLFSPFDGNVIPTGAAQEIAVYNYCCVNPPEPGEDPQVTPLEFCDNVLGNPLKENVIVIGGLSVSPELENGTFTCNPGGPPPPPPEICDNGIDDDQDGLIDDADPDCQQMFACGSREVDENGIPLPLEASIGSDVEVCFFVKSPEDNAPGHAQFDHIQGFSMALSFCCDLSAGSDLDVSGTIVEAVGAEFVTAQADNDPNDGDGCELILGVLVDALPPFDGATIPPLPNFQRVGCVTFTVRDDAPCGECCPIEFTDGVNGTGKVPVKNLISVENVSRSPQTMDCEVCIVGEEVFYRGDCNFSRMGGGMAVDISDAAAVVSFLFLPGTWKFNPPCLDACDCNDDGRIDLADAICILQYYLQNGAFPPAPGPGLQMTTGPNPNNVEPTGPGPDPTEDKLDCEAGNECP